MNYELAKSLQDSGFKHLHGAGCYEFETGTCAPTLSELIAACGDGLWRIERYFDGTWFVNDCNNDGSVDYYKTPEEAVANLWLELNKK